MPEIIKTAVIEPELAKAEIDKGLILKMNLGLYA